MQPNNTFFTSVLEDSSLYKFAMAQGGICSRDSRGYTALHYAALNGHKEVAQLLLSYEASCNSVDEAGSSPLHLASWAGHGELVRQRN